jgi:ABC-type spermidine/putrescine transport system permease subunit I
VNAAAATLANGLRRLGAVGNAAYGRWFVIALPYLWLAVFFLIPFLIVLKIAFANIQLSMPPIEPVVTWTGDKVLQLRLHFSNFTFVFGDELYVAAFLNSLKVAGVSTALALLIGYPMAYGIAIFHVVPAARLRLARVARTQRADQRAAAQGRPDSRATAAVAD